MLKIAHHRLAFSLFLLGCFLNVICFLPKVLFLNRSKSMPRGLYLRVISENFEVGDIVVYEPTADVVALMRERRWLQDGQEPIPFLKYIGALPGDTYSVKRHIFSINSACVGEILERDGKGQALPQLPPGLYDVPLQTFLPLANDPHGFDGRYTGCVPMERIIAKVIPIWVVN